MPAWTSTSFSHQCCIMLKHRGKAHSCCKTKQLPSQPRLKTQNHYLSGTTGPRAARRREWGASALHSSHCRFTGLLSHFNRMKLGERNTTHKFAPSVIQEERKKMQSSPRFMSPPELQLRKTKTHTHIHTKSEGKRDPTCSFIPLSCCLTETWTRAAQKGSVQKVWLQTAEKQPLISNVHFTFAWHFFFSMVCKHHRNLPGPLLTWEKGGQNRALPCQSSDLLQAHLVWAGTTVHPLLFVPSLFPGTQPCQCSLCTSYFTCRSSATFRRAVL